MTESTAVREYAEAMFMLAGENQSYFEYSEALKTLRDLLTQNPLYIELLASPGISMDERRNAIDEAFGNDGIFSHITSFLKLLCERGHIREIISIIDEFQAMYKFESGISTAYVTSAVELLENEKQSLCVNLEKKLARRIDLVCSVDPAIVGGLVIRVDDKIIDGSIRGRLSELRRMMERCEQHNEPQTR